MIGLNDLSVILQVIRCFRIVRILINLYPYIYDIDRGICIYMFEVDPLKYVIKTIWALLGP